MSTKKAALKKKSTIITLVVSVGAMVAVLFVFGAMQANRLAREEIQRIASEALGVTVTIEDVDIQPQKKQVTVSGIAVGNAPGYVNTHSMLIGTVRIVAESLSPQALLFNKVAVADLRVNLEIAEQATNLTDIRKEAKKRATSYKDSNPVDPVKVIIRNLSINDARIVPSGAVVQEAVPNLNIGAFTLSDIGVKENGVLAGEALAAVVSGVTKQIIGESAKAGLLGNISAETLNEMKSQLGLDVTIVDQAKENLENITSGIKDMLGAKSSE